MIKRFQDLDKSELSSLENVIKRNHHKFLLTMNSIRDIENDCLIIENSMDIAIFKIKPAPFDENGIIIYILFSSCSDISKFILELEENYNNIYIDINQIIEQSKHGDLYETITIKDNREYPIDKYLCTSYQNINKPIERFISDKIPKLDFSKLKYYDLSDNEFDEFIRNNYLEATGKILEWVNNCNINLFGFYYTFCDDPRHNCRFLISSIPNSLAKETIVGVVKYNLNYEVLSSYQTTYISYIETNYFYQRQGVFKKMVNRFVDIIPNQLLILSYESPVGEIVGTQRIMKQAVKDKKLPIDVLTCNGRELYDYLESKKLIK